MKKVAIIFGSPRKNSNTHLLVQEAQKGLADSGIASEIFFLNEMNIKGCQACYYCKKNNDPTCCIKDDMQKLYLEMTETQGIIVASPIYFGGVTAQTKVWLDRLFPFIDLKVNSLLPQGKKAALIFTQNQPYPELFLEPIKSFTSMLNYIGYEIKDSLIAYDLDKGYKPMVSENKEFMKKAYDLGKNLLA